MWFWQGQSISSSLELDQTIKFWRCFLWTSKIWHKDCEASMLKNVMNYRCMGGWSKAYWSPWKGILSQTQCEWEKGRRRKKWKLGKRRAKKKKWMRQQSNRDFITALYPCPNVYPSLPLLFFQVFFMERPYQGPWSWPKSSWHEAFCQLSVRLFCSYQTFRARAALPPPQTSPARLLEMPSLLLGPAPLPALLTELARVLFCRRITLLSSFPHCEFSLCSETDSRPQQSSPKVQN